MESWKADEKQIDEVKSEDEVESEERRCNSAKVRRKKIHPCQMLEKSRNAVFLPMIRVSGESKAHFEVKMYQTLHVRTTFWSWDVEKLHAAVARSTFWSQNLQNTACSDHFLKLRCGKMARRCSEKHILKWKCTKHVSFGPLFEVAMWKNCTPLWREAHFEVKIVKNWRSRSTFGSSDVEKLHAAVARSTFQNVQNTCVSPHFLTFRCRKISQLVKLGS